MNLFVIIQEEDLKWIEENIPSSVADGWVILWKPFSLFVCTNFSLSVSVSLSLSLSLCHVGFKLIWLLPVQG